MKKSWTKPWTIVYEIKQSRSDFLHDTKWPEYIKYCTDFYFVAPPGIIQPEELPPHVGLLVTSKNHTRLYTKRKAVHRDVQIPDSIFRYILMWRVKITNRRDVGQTMQEYWQAWLAQRDEKKELGYNVAKKIGELVEERIHKVTMENDRLERENERLAEMKEIMNDLGYDKSFYSMYGMKDKLRARVKEIETGLPEDLITYLSNVIKNLELIREKFK